MPPALFYSLARRRGRQTSGAGLGTPTLMLVALALRLADHLREITARDRCVVAVASWPRPELREPSFRECGVRKRSSTSTWSNPP